ncbi:hypothetical protein [Escherichia albertii]|uniref:hypothetical protein n=1 Tax=Escherichia albertii TaxID=208962 RepID=UPI00235E5B09|nr:hypothetical protein [Escherichia albertii]WDB92601.1 hypothetical protein PS050_21035 [Escherichia albertii]
MDDKSELEYIHSEYADALNLPSLDLIRNKISEFYSQGVTQKYIFFIELSMALDRRFVRKILHESDFIAPVYVSIALIILSAYHLINKGKVEHFGMWPFYFDTITISIIGISLLLSSFPFLLASFNRNMQEITRKNNYIIDVIKIVAIFIAILLILLLPLTFLGITDFHIHGVYDIRPDRH